MTWFCYRYKIIDDLGTHRGYHVGSMQPTKAVAIALAKNYSRIHKIPYHENIEGCPRYKGLEAVTVI